MKTQLYDDFGLKIEGARKFNYTGQSIQDFSNLDSVSKNLIWPEPEIGQKDLFVEFIIHKVRDCICFTSSLCKNSIRKC